MSSPPHLGNLVGGSIPPAERGVHDRKFNWVIWGKDFHIYQHAKHKIYNSILSWDIAYQTQHTCHFEYFRYIWPQPSKMIVSIYRLLWCSPVQKINFPLTSFLKYCTDFAIWLFWVIWVGLVMHNKINGINM